MLPAARRELREHPVLAIPLGIAVMAAIGVTLAAVTRSVDAVRALAAIVAAAWLFLIWRARPSQGRRAGRPPGSLGFRQSLHAIVDPDFNRRAAGRHGPVFKMAEFHRPVVCVVGLGTGRGILRDHGAALRPAVRPPLAAAIPRGFLRYMTPDDRAVYGPFLRAALSDRVLTQSEVGAGGAIRDALTGLAEASARTAQRGVDPRGALARALSSALLDLFFGGLLRAEDRAAVAACARDADLRTAGLWLAPRAKRALARFTALIGTRSAAYDGAGEPSLWGELVRRDPALARSATVTGNLFLLLKDAQTNLLELFRWIVKRLGQAPEWRARVRREARAPLRFAPADDDPAARAVIETLRLADEYVYREVLQPITIDHFTIPRGWLLRICIAESHRQDPPFANPDRFDPDRHLGRHYGAHELSPFGLDEHACIAARLTLLFGRLLAAELLYRFDCTIVADGPVARGNRHWALWQPSADLRVAVRRCDDLRGA